MAWWNEPATAEHEKAIADAIEEALSGRNTGGAPGGMNQSFPNYPSTLQEGASTQAAIAAQTAMMDALAEGNREKFEEARRQFEASLAEQRRQFDTGRGDSQRRLFMELFGYDPGQGFSGGSQGAQGIGPAGSYTTVNGVRTVDQMRNELREAGFPNWQAADEGEIVSVYGRTTGGPVNPAGGQGAPAQGAQGGGLNPGWSKELMAIYETVKAKKAPNLPALPPNDPDLIKAVTARFGFTPEEAQNILQQGRDYYIATGQVIPEEVLQASINRTRPFGDQPTLPARRFDEDRRQFDAKFGEEQRQFDQSQYSDFAKSLLSASVNMRGPRDYRQYQQMLGGGKDILEQLSGSTPQAAFGMQGNPERARVSDILEQLGLFSRPGAVPRTPAQPPPSGVDTIDGRRYTSMAGRR